MRNASLLLCWGLALAQRAQGSAEEAGFWAAVAACLFCLFAICAAAVYAGTGGRGDSGGHGHLARVGSQRWDAAFKNAAGAPAGVAGGVYKNPGAAAPPADASAPYGLVAGTVVTNPVRIDHRGRIV